jgi:hypothetical protein
VLVHWLSFFKSYCPQFTNSSFDHLCPWLIWILFVFLFKGHSIAPSYSTFQEVSRSVDVISVKDFANSIDVLLLWQSFLFWNQISYFKVHVYSSLIVEMKSEMYFFKIKLVWLNTQHTPFNTCSPLIDSL